MYSDDRLERINSNLSKSAIKKKTFNATLNKLLIIILIWEIVIAGKGDISPVI